MTVASIEAAIAKGRGISARVLGYTFQIYRPLDPLAPITPYSRIGSMPCLFTPQPDAYRAPNLPTKPWWYGEFDTRLALPGDIFQGDAGTWLYFAQQQYTAPLCVSADRIITVMLPQAVSGHDGLNGYSGTTATNSTPILAGWPASIILGTKGEVGLMKLPGDARSPWWAITLPPTLGVIIPHGAIITDDIGRRFSVSAAELSTGWRLTAQQDVT